jgi:predicted DNA-binding protein (MmcQ/YjbR family)
MSIARAADELMAHALALPEAWEDHPWGERVAKVGKKVFLFCGKPHGQESVSFSVKLPRSGVAALDRPECEPTGYGLGKSGWVTAQYERGDVVPLELAKAWIDESYRAIAPKTLVKALDGVPSARAQAGRGVRKKKTSSARTKVATKTKRVRSRPK